MAVPTLHASATGAYVPGGSTTDIAVPYPTVSAADVLVLHIVEKNAGNPFETPTTPSGWTALFAADFLDDGTQARSWVFTKVATGAESGSLTVTFSGTTNYRMARMYAFSGASGSVEGGNLRSDNGATILQPNLVTTGVDRLAVALVASVSAIAVGDFTGETGGNFVEAVAEYAPNATLQLETAAMAVAGTISGGSQVSTAAAYNVRVFALLAGAPAATGSYLGVTVRGIG